MSHAVGKDLNAVRIVLHEGGNIAGMVTVDGVPAPGATVYVLHNMETQPVMVARAETAGDGTFTLENVGPGPTMVHGGVVLEPTLVQRWMYRTIPVEGGGTVPAALVFATGDCALFANVTHEGQPVSGVYVMVNHTIDRTAFNMARVETDPDGNYLFEGLPPGQYEFTVLIPGVDHSRQPLAQTILLTNGKALQLDVVN